jgi:hypothetical protein
MTITDSDSGAEFSVDVNRPDNQLIDRQLGHTIGEIAASLVASRKLPSLAHALFVDTEGELLDPLADRGVLVYTDLTLVTSSPTILKERLTRLHVERIREDPDNVKRVPEALCDDDGFILACAESSYHIIKYASARLRGDPSFMRRVLARWPEAIRYARPPASDDAGVVVVAVSQDGHLLKHASEAARGDARLMRAAVINAGIGAGSKAIGAARDEYIRLARGHPSARLRLSIANKRSAEEGYHGAHPDAPHRKRALGADGGL